jgi:hypothetical protein
VIIEDVAEDIKVVEIDTFNCKMHMAGELGVIYSAPLCVEQEQTLETLTSCSTQIKVSNFL